MAESITAVAFDVSNVNGALDVSNVTILDVSPVSVVAVTFLFAMSPPPEVPVPPEAEHTPSPSVADANVAFATPR